ncbi:NAD(P)-binding domain-containing protein, partial [Acinetobacter baumannii]
RTLAKATPLGAYGVTVCSTVAEAARGAERVHIMLSDDAAVDGAIDALLADLAEDLGAAIVVDHSTTSPGGAAMRAARLEARQIP